MVGVYLASVIRRLTRGKVRLPSRGAVIVVIVVLAVVVVVRFVSYNIFPLRFPQRFLISFVSLDIVHFLPSNFHDYLLFRASKNTIPSHPHHRQLRRSLPILTSFFASSFLPLALSWNSIRSRPFSFLLFLRLSVPC